MVQRADTDPDIGAFRWAYRHLVESHRPRSVVALVVIPAAGGSVALASRGTLSPGVAFLLGVLATYVVMVAAFGFFASVVVPYQQRTLLRRRLSAMATRLHELEEVRPDELVGSVHAGELKDALRDMMAEADALKSISLHDRPPRGWVVAHFPELQSLVETWNATTLKASERERALDAKFRLRIQSLNFVQDGFARDALDQLLQWVKSDAISGGANDTRDIVWLDDPDHPDALLLWTGRTVVHTTEEKPHLTRATAQQRLNAFIREVREWKELRRYGENRELFHSSEMVLLRLKERFDQHSYFTSPACARCTS